MSGALKRITGIALACSSGWMLCAFAMSANVWYGWAFVGQLAAAIVFSLIEWEEKQ